ncbi:ABC transporter substrate-binding protein, partial [Mesorhizobium sp. M2C.T.Ca.TU.009.01.2.1]
DKWWGKFPEKPFDRVLDRFVADGANRARGLEGGEFDLANFVPLDEALRIGTSSGFHLVEGNNLWAWPAIYLNMDLAPTNNKDFREALVKAFDYNAMVQSFQGKAEVGRGPVPSWFPGSPEKEEAEIKTDLDGAKAALAKSGLANAKMKCSVPAGFPEFRFAATVLQSSAQQLGVTVEIEEQPFV